MARFENSFPFAAVEGQDDIKRALMIAAVNPAVCGVLISGEKGTAKSTLVRGLSALLDEAPFVELPLNITEDKLVGSIDLERAVVSGKLALDPGLLKKADGGFIYVDEINLLSEHITNTLLQAASAGENIVEREGISCRQPSRFVLIGSMNPEEGPLRPQLLDRFGLYVSAAGERDARARAKIMRRRLEYERAPVSFRDKWRGETQALFDKLRVARTLVASTVVPEVQLRFAASLAKASLCAGHRAELVLCEAARAIAALDGRHAVSEDDIRAAAAFALPHRLREALALPERREEEKAEPHQRSEDERENELAPSELPPAPNDVQGSSKDDWQDIEPVEMNLTLHLPRAGKKAPAGSGKRLKVKAHAKRGRYVRYRLPAGKPSDIAFDATLRAAASHPCELPGLAVQVKKEDIREKVRERRTGAVILFLVDASGSMGARRRMGAVKGAVLELLQDAYQKRDTVGIIVFREKSAECVLNLTRSVDLAEKCLRDLHTGGKTPLAAGLLKAYDVLKTDRIKNPDVLQYLVIVSDGRANVPLFSADAFEDARSVAKKFRAESIRSLVLDTENGYMRFALAEKLSEALGSEYVRLTEVTGSTVNNSVRQFLAT